MYIVTIDEDTCTGCNLCAEGCPSRLLTFDEEKKKTSVTGDETECMGCEACVTVCESGAITVIEL